MDPAMMIVGLTAVRMLVQIFVPSLTPASLLLTWVAKTMGLDED